MKKINEFIDFTGLTELVSVAIRELFPNFGKHETVKVYIYDQKYSQFFRNKMR